MRQICHLNTGYRGSFFRETQRTWGQLISRSKQLIGWRTKVNTNTRPSYCTMTVTSYYQTMTILKCQYLHNLIKHPNLKKLWNAYWDVGFQKQLREVAFLNIYKCHGNAVGSNMTFYRHTMTLPGLAWAHARKLCHGKELKMSCQRGNLIVSWWRV